uniref:Uncharacterized protein n=1 Tax=Lepeophtheirus salmonis TaxID=72036 RepID=A0A0K2UIJ3_LEPSM
MLFGFQNKSN